MIKKIIHISDLHIPNSINGKRPYDKMLKSFLKQLYRNEIEGQDADSIRIVIVGDIYHNKDKITNEAQAMFHELLNTCNCCCRTYIVAGNHDMIEHNHDKMDSINPTFVISDVYPNVIYLDKFLDFKSGHVEDDNVVWSLYSIHDSFAPNNVLHKMYRKHKVVGLYHGDVVGSVTDVGYVSESGIDTGIFSECDCVMAGHIHKHQEIKENGIPLVYAGSVFQQNAGENTTGHGYVVWEINDDGEMTYKHVEVENDYRIFKFQINDYDDFTNDVEILINL